MTGPQIDNTVQQAPVITMKRRLPSSCQLPEEVWDEAMDRFICNLEAEGEVDTGEILRKLKRRFPILEQASLSIFS